MTEKERDRAALYARLDDICEQAQRGEVGISQFLTEAECRYSEVYLERRAAEFFMFGGYDGAERKRIYVLPDYMESEGGVKALEEYGISSQIKVKKIIGSGYRKLSHRDFLGALLGLGIKREVVGDIVVLDDNSSAVFFCDEKISRFIEGDLSQVASDKVKVTDTDIAANSLPSRKMQDVFDTVSSARLDCVVAALFSLSRDFARELIESGLVELDFEVEDRCDKKLTPPCTVSARGYGKVRVNRLDVKTKKGRYRLEAQKYV